MKERAEAIALFTEFMAGLDHTPTMEHCRAFVDDLPEDKLRRLLASMLFDSCRGLLPPKRTAAA